MVERQRNIQQKFWVTEDEMALIQAKMKLLGTEQRGAYYRKMAIDGYIINVDFAVLKDNTAQLQRIGGNVNQIVKRMNQTGSLYADDVEEVKEILKEIWLTQRSILSRLR